MSGFLSSGIVNAAPEISRFEFEQDVTDSWGNSNATDNTSDGYETGAPVGTYAKLFDGTDDHLRAPILHYMPFTVSTYIKTTDTSIQSPYGLVPTGDLDPRLNLFINSDAEFNNNTGYLSARILDEGSNRIDFEHASNSGITDGNYHMVTWACDGANSDVQMYVDGSPVSTTITSNQGISSGTGVDYNGDDVGIGARFNNGSMENYVNGALDDLRLYDKRLSDTEVSNLYSNNSI